MPDAQRDELQFELAKTGELRIDGWAVRSDYRIVQAVQVAGLVVALYDPDADPRTYGTFRNLVAFSRDGRLAWVAETPTSETGDCFYAIRSAQPLIALSVKSFHCELDPSTGKIASRTFTK